MLVKSPFDHPFVVYPDGRKGRSGTKAGHEPRIHSTPLAEIELSVGY
jgi:hypothetical protein